MVAVMPASRLAEPMFIAQQANIARKTATAYTMRLCPRAKNVHSPVSPPTAAPIN